MIKQYVSQINTYLKSRRFLKEEPAEEPVITQPRLLGWSALDGVDYSIYFFFPCNPASSPSIGANHMCHLPCNNF